MMFAWKLRALYVPLKPTLLNRKYASSYLGKWLSPEGYETGLIVYNTTVNKKVPLVLSRKEIATWYICGPTVYADSHIGHASCYVKFDIIRRVLEKVFNINVILQMGVTDIDDKIINKARELDLSVFELSKQYELEFFEDMKLMKVLPPTIISRVTENISSIISFCQKLVENNSAYVTEQGNVYFMVSKGVSSDVLFDLPDENRVMIDPQKKDQRDFALWKASKSGEPSWSSPWGKGRPGWHIECSAMASQIFGSQVDIHSGGYDLLFPHHSNEESQSKAYHGCKQWVNYWWHAGLLQLADQSKMSKSVGNTITVKEFLKENSANDFRILCLQSLYRKNISYSSEILSGAQALHKKIHAFINDSELYINGELGCSSFDDNELLLKLSNTKDKVVSLLSNDFNTSQALFCLTDLIDEVNKCLQSYSDSAANNPNNVIAIAACMNYVNTILELLGVHIMNKKRMPLNLVHLIDSAVEFRNKIRLLALFRLKLDSEQKYTLSILADHIFKLFNCKIKTVSSTEKVCNSLSIVEDVESLYKKTANYISSEQLSSINVEVKKASNDEKKRMAPLFSFCDEFRSSLQEKGIGIKDRSDVSSWIPLPSFEKYLF